MGMFLRKDENDCVKKCMDFKVKGVRPRGRPKETWTEDTEKDCQPNKYARKMLWIVENGES